MCMHSLGIHVYPPMQWLPVSDIDTHNDVLRACMAVLAAYEEPFLQCQLITLNQNAVLARRPSSLNGCCVVQQT